MHLSSKQCILAAVLANGGPGTGKAYGCGCWWLPGLYDGRDA